MEFVAKQSALLRELSLVQGVVEKKNTVPILANVMLRSEDDHVQLLATDLDVAVRSLFDASVTRPGGLTVSARKLHEIVRALPDSEVQIKADAENWVTITCERSHFRVMGLPREDFPTLPAAPAEGRVTLGVQQFREMVQKVIFAITVEDARFALNGALMILARDKVTLVASDGHRLALVSRPLPGSGPETETRVLIPHKALGEVSRISEELGGEMIFSRHENHLFFEMGRCTLSSRVLEGQFPSFEKVMPKGNDKIVELNRIQITDALRRVSLMANERSRAVRVALSEGKLEVSAKNPETGEARETIGVSYQGGEMEVGFNARYLLDFLGAADSEMVTFEMKDEATQGLFRPVTAPASVKPAKGEKTEKSEKAGRKGTPGGGEYAYVVMPMRI